MIGQTATESRQRFPRLALLSCLAAAALTGCHSYTQSYEDHWNINSVSRRMVYAATGYEPNRDGSYKDFQYEQKRSINLTVRKHLFNLDPGNPFKSAPKSYMAERPPHSILPDPFNYFHLTSLVVGGALSATSFGFVPIPIDSLIGTFEPGGPSEFSEGIFGGKKRVSRHTRHVPADVEDFELKHKVAPTYFEPN